MTTLADVRVVLEKHLPASCREKETWRYVADRLAEATRGGDTAKVAAALVILLTLEEVPCRPVVPAKAARRRA